MLTDFLKLGGGMVLLITGAELLVRGATALAIRIGISPLVVGLTVVAFGTSSPELIVCVKDSLQGSGQLALGTVVGSNICNILLIMGFSALLYPIKVQRSILRLDMPLMLGASFALCLILLTGQVSRLTGLGFLFALVAYTWYSIARSRKFDVAAAEDPAKNLPAPSPLPVLLLLLVLGPALLSFGSDLLLSGARNIAKAMSISEAVVGLTLVAFGSSLPELATAVVCAVKKQSDLVVGNVVGSNIFNILSVLGISSLVHPIAFQGVTWIDIAVMISASVLLVPLMITKRLVERWEGGLLLMIYCGYVAWLFIGA
jgi:cation:H+ antiporter